MRIGYYDKREHGPRRQGLSRIMAKQSLIKEFFLFVRHEKKYWLVPLIMVLLVVGAIILFSSSSPLAPFLYPMF
jgi:hypothetical protein